MGERAWVENELAQRLVLSVCSVFPTALPAGVVNRYPGPEIRAQVANYVISMVNHQVQWEVANTPNLVRFLPLVLGYAEVRAIAASRMDGTCYQSYVGMGWSRVICGVGFLQLFVSELQG